MALSDNDALIAPDYLGVPSEVSARGTASLPTDQPFQPSAAPATTGGSGSAPTSVGTTLGTRQRPRFDFALGTGGATAPIQTLLEGDQAPQGGVVTAGADPTRVTIPIPEDVQTAVMGLPPEARATLLERLAAQGGKLAELGKELTKLFPDDLGTFNRGASEEAFQAQRAGERADFSGFMPGVGADTTFKELQNLRDPFGFGDFATEGIGGPGLDKADMLASAAAEFGETGAEGIAGLGTAVGNLGTVAGPIMSGLNILNTLNQKGPADKRAFDTAAAVGGAVANVFAPGIGGVAANLVHQFISTPIVEAIFGEFGPSKNWLNFPNELAQTLTLTEGSNQKLAASIANAQSPDEISKAIAEWKSAIGGRVGGFGEGTGAFDIPDVPGATGSKHEGGISVNFNPQTAGLRAMATVAQRGGTLAERIQAFREAAIGAMSDTERIAADPSGSLLTPQMQESWKASLIEQTQQRVPEVAKALETGQLTPVQAQGVLDAMSPGTTSFVGKPAPEILAKFVPDQGAPVYDAERGGYYTPGPPLTPQEQAAQDFAIAGFSAGGG